MLSTLEQRVSAEWPRGWNLNLTRAKNAPQSFSELPLMTCAYTAKEVILGGHRFTRCDWAEKRRLREETGGKKLERKNTSLSSNNWCQGALEQGFV